MVEKKEKTIEETYKKLSQREHVLHRPGMYIGEIKKTLEEQWVYDTSVNKMVKRMVEYSSGFMKIFDEVLTNATDHSFRDSNVTTIKVEYNVESGEISIWNNGSGIPIELHKEHNIYVPELIFGHMLSGSNYDDTNARTGAGTNGLGSKCNSLDTNIPLFNGEIKLAKDIKIGDVLIGDDGNKRTVLSTVFGKGKMYEVSQNRGDSYKVNEEHILTLHMPDHKVIYWNTNGWSILWWNMKDNKIESKFIKAINEDIKCEECGVILNSRLKRHYSRRHSNQSIPIKPRKSPNNIPDMNNEKIFKAYDEIVNFSRTIDDNNVFDISIKDYLSLSKTTQSRLAGLRGECVNWNYKDIELDPYVLGLWLGDGMKSGYSYSCDGENDYQLIDYLKEWGLKNDSDLKQSSNKYCYNFSSIENFHKKGFAPLKKILYKYNLINNKHIPKEYLINSREVRLKVLAGIIDTDGTLSRDGTRIGISQSWKHEKLIFDILYLARSLGFCCSINTFIAKYKLSNGERKESKAYKVNISGNIKDIPTLLPRKKCNNTFKQNTDKSTGQIKIKEIEDLEYIGIHIDKNERFLINDFTVTHNCSNIFSKRFIVETVDSERSLKFIQEYEDNMEKKSKAKVTKNSGKSYTKITFVPDYSRFGMKNLETDTISLINKRVYDCIACTRSDVQIFLNGEKIKGKGLIDYGNYFFDNTVKMYHELNVQKINGNEMIWEYIIVPWDKFEHVSFVNGNSTHQGGKHVDHIIYQITAKLKTLLETKKKLKDVKPAFIREKMFLFLRATIINPSFSSQTKEQLTTATKDFGCKIEVPDKFIDKLWKSPIINEIVELCKMKESMDLAKTTDGRKRNKIYIPKLEDALWAGTLKSDQCTLILTEGLSAMTFAMWGRSVVGPEKYGVFPLKGKILNVRDASISQLINNEEINNLKQIIGLRQNMEYMHTSSLRYGKVMILTDADTDGTHIKSLLVNFIHAQWPSLLKLDFIQTVRTPIVKAIKNKKVIEFFTEQDYNKWKSSINTTGYQIRYFKGLGTSNKSDAQDTFKRIEELKMNYYYKDQNCDESILLAFDKDKNVKITEDVVKCSDKRKKWLSNYDKNTYIDVKENKISYDDLINKELIHFSIYDNLRSIPSLCDGLKPSQRKILCYMLKKNITKVIKVAQLSGYVSAEMGYHHGEASLQGAIINMAQNFVGTNNINLLYPDGNFGSRLLNGKDAASPRYIYTRLSDITQTVFNSHDTPLLSVLDDDGTPIEPEWFLPVIPMVLVNGCEGIGTGYSTFIPPFNPTDIIANLLRVLDDLDPLEMTPWFKNFKGDLLKGEFDGSYVTRGKWEKLSDTQIRIVELPIGVGVTIYKEFLETFIEESGNKKDKQIKKKFVLKDVQNKTKDENDQICFIVEFKNKKDLDAVISNGTLEKELKLTKSFTTNNMYLFNDSLILSKYNNPNDILLDFYDIRLEYYQKRKDYIVKQLKQELIILEAKARFIKEYIEGVLDINKKSKEYLISLLEEREYPVYHVEGNYDYLTRMPIISMTSEKIKELENQCQNKRTELKNIMSKTDKDLWKIDLNNILKMLG